MQRLVAGCLDRMGCFLAAWYNRIIQSVCAISAQGSPTERKGVFLRLNVCDLWSGVQIGKTGALGKLECYYAWFVLNICINAGNTGKTHFVLSKF